MKKLICQLSSKFQNISLKNNKCKFVYFIFKLAFSIPLLSIFLFIPCQLLIEFQISQEQLKKISTFIIESEWVVLVLLLVCFLLKCFHVTLMIKSFKEMVLKTSILLFLFDQAIGNIIIAILIFIISQNSINISIILISLLLFFSILGSTLIVQKIFISFSYSPKNQLSHKSNNFILFLNICQKVLFCIGIYLLFNLKDISHLSGYYYFTLFALKMLGLSSYLKQSYYIDQKSHQFQSFNRIVSLVLLFIVLVYEIYPDEIIIKNFLVLCAIISGFALVSNYLYANFKKNELIFENINKMMQQQQVGNYLSAILKLWKNKFQTYNSLMISSIHKNHSYTCKKVNCYCSSKFSQNKTQQQSKDIFFIGYLHQIVSSIKQLVKNDKKLTLQVLSFQFQVFKNHVIINQELHRQKFQKDNSWDIQIGKYILQGKIIQQIQKRNKLTSNVNVQLPLKLGKVLKELEKLIINDINTKTQKWKYLSKSSCKLHEIQEKIVKQIQNFKNIQQIYNQNNNNFQQNISFNALCMFYFGQIVFFDKQYNDSITKLQKLKNSINQNEVKTNRDLTKNIFNDKLCVLEFNLCQVQHFQQIMMLQIINCNNNVEKVFSYNRSKFIGQKIQKLIPHFLWDHEKKLLNNFLKQQNSKQYQQPVDKYYLDRKGCLFQGLSSFKIVPKKNELSLVLLVFQKHRNNIILLDQNNLIQNIGDVYINYFGKVYNKLPIQSLFYSNEEYRHLKFLKEQSECKFKLINGSLIGKNWTKFIYSIQNQINSKMSNSKQKNHLKNQAQNNKQTQRSISKIVKRQKSALFNSLKNTNDKNYISISSNLMNQSNGKCPLISVKISFKSYIKDDFQYRVIIFREIKNNVFDCDKSINTFASYNSNYTQNSKTKQQKNQCQQQYEGKSISNKNSEFLNNKLQPSNQQLKLNQFNRQQESQKYQNINKQEAIPYFFKKFVELCFNLFQKPSSIQDKRLVIFTLLSILIIIIIIILLIGSYVIFHMGLFQIKDIFFADGGVSDIMQLTQMMYNRGMNFKQYRYDSILTQMITISAFYQRKYFYKLFQQSFQDLLAHKTSMTQSQFYQYQKVPVLWKFNNKNQEEQIQSNQFLTYYYFLSKQIQRAIHMDTQTSNQMIDSALNLMRINFPEMKRINYRNLKLYQQMSDHSINLMQKLIIILGLIHIVLSFLILLLFYREKIFRRKQQIESYSIYKIIPQNAIKIMSYHYQKLFCQVKKQDDLAVYETFFQIQGLHLPKDHQFYFKRNKCKFIYEDIKIPFSVWKLSFLLILINLIFGEMLLEVNSLFKPMDIMMTKVNDLMASQNFLLEAYFDLKAKFIIEKNSVIDPAFFDELLKTQNNSQVTFNKISTASFQLFSQYDSTYKADFIDLLINDTCELAKNQISPQSYTRCKNFSSLLLLENGVMTGMNFFTRKVRSAIQKLKQQFSISQLTDIQKKEMTQNFKNLQFKQIDESIFFMFKMYQATQARIYGSLETVLNNKMDLCYLLIVVQILIIGILYPIVLLLNHKWQKVQISKLYLSFVLIPTPVSKMINSFTRKIEQLLQLNKL